MNNYLPLLFLFTTLAFIGFCLYDHYIVQNKEEEKDYKLKDKSSYVKNFKNKGKR